MTPEFQRLMHDATVLVRAGDLQAATAAIQTALQAPPPAAPHARGMPSVPGDIVIDVHTREVDHPPPRRAPLEGSRLPAPPPEGAGSFVAARFEDGHAARDYMLYVPPQAGAQPLPLIVMLHGCTQDAADFASGTEMNRLARAHGFFVVYPEQSSHANPQRCWNWFKHTHQARGRGEPELLAGMTREVMARHSIDASRVYVAGLSAGGAMAAILGDAYPDLFAAVGVHSGLATGIAKDLPSALGAMQRGPAVASAATSGVPTIVFHGDADATVHPGNGEHVIAASVHKEAAVEEHAGVSAGGRRYTRQVHRAPDGRVVAEHWVVHGAAHAWSGGSAQGTYTDPRGPDASTEMMRFFFSITNEPSSSSMQ
jgi:poly(hydroxyalkanoate) depolymerase family esterase